MSSRATDVYTCNAYATDTTPPPREDRQRTQSGHSSSSSSGRLVAVVVAVPTSRRARAGAKEPGPDFSASNSLLALAGSVAALRCGAVRCVQALLSACWERAGWLDLGLGGNGDPLIPNDDPKSPTTITPTPRDRRPLALCSALSGFETIGY